MLIVSIKRLLRKRRIITKDNSISVRLFKLLIILSLILILHAIAMVHFETLSINDSIWLTMTSATTVGYGDFAAKTTWGRISTIILLYVGGIAILAQAAASYFEHRQEVKDRMLRGDWSWVMREHIVFLNCPKEIDEEYFYQAVKGLRRSASELASLPIIIVSEAFNYGISNRLRELDVVYVNKPYFNDEVLKSCSICQAHTIVILSKDQLDPTSDSINFELVHRLREIEVKGRIIVESVRDKNRARLKKAGANNVLRPIRAYPEMLIRAIIAPGSEQIIETLFNSYGEECIRYEVVITRSWLDIIHKFAANDLGIPIAFENGEGDVISVPSSSEVVTAIAIYAIVNEGRSRTNKEIEVILKAA